MDWSIAFWSLARALATCFFCWVTPLASFRHSPSNRTYLGLLSLLEESLLGLLLLALLLGEVVRGGGLLDGLLVNTLDVDTGAGGDHIAGVHTAERNTVDLEGTGNEENTLFEVLEEDDTLATEATGEEDEDSTGLEALPDLSGTQGLADLLAIKQNVRSLIINPR